VNPAKGKGKKPAVRVSIEPENCHDSITGQSD
jgi:hypothetical protein